MGRVEKQEFQAMIKRNGEKIFDKLSDVVLNPKRELRKGQKVMFTNEYGITFGAYEILGFCEPCLNGRCVYLDKSSYWFPAHPEELTVQENGKEVENETATE